MRKMPLCLSMTLAAIAFGLSCATHAHSSDVPSALTAVASPWKDSFDSFAAADKLRAPPPDGVVFVGSSSIRLWNDLEEQFDTLPRVIKRGFGGSRMSDCAEHRRQLVIAYKPRLVIVYAGDNDLAEGRTPEQVLASYAAFVDGVRKELPATRIAYLSIKPSPLRASLMPLARETNTLIAAYSASQTNLDYIDVYSKMLDDSGSPRAELFLADALHLSDAGYALWKSVIASHLR